MVVNEIYVVEVVKQYVCFFVIDILWLIGFNFFFLW